LTHTQNHTVHVLNPSGCTMALDQLSLYKKSVLEVSPEG